MLFILSYELTMLVAVISLLTWCLSEDVRHEKITGLEHATKYDVVDMFEPSRVTAE